MGSAQRGLTLLELMLVAVIVGTVAVVAISAYREPAIRAGFGAAADDPHIILLQPIPGAPSDPSAEMVAAAQEPARKCFMGLCR
jgi:prepilin-type N-terminal cleavage/methylation domain-containing protein